MPVHNHTGPAARADYGPHVGIYASEIHLVDDPSARLSAVVGGVRALPGPSLRGDRRWVLVAARPVVEVGRHLHARSTPPRRCPTSRPS